MGAVLYLARGALLAPLVERQLVRLAREAGGELRIGSIGGSWVSDLILTDLGWSVAPAGPTAGLAAAGPLRSLAEGRLELEYSLWRAFRGEADWLRAVRFEAQRVEVELGAETGSESGSELRLPTVLPDVAIEVAILELHDGDQLHARLSAIHLSGTRGDAGADQEVRLDVERVALGGRAEVPLHLDLRYAPDRLRIDALTLGDQLELDGTLGLADVAAGAFDWDLNVRLGAGVLRTSGEFADARLGAALTCTGVELGDVTRELGFEPLQARLDLEAEVVAAIERSGDAGFDLAETLRATTGHLEVRVDGATLASDFPRLGGEPALRRLELQAEILMGGRAQLAGRLETPAGDLNLRTGSFALAAAPRDPILEGQLALELDANFASLEELGRLLGRTGWSGELRGDLALEGPPLAPRGRLQARGEDIVLEGVGLDSLALDLRAEGDSLGVGLELAAHERQLQADCRVVRTDAGVEVDLASLSLSGRPGAWHLGRPASIVVDAAGALCEELVLTSGDGRAVVGFRVAGTDGEAELVLAGFDPALVTDLLLPAGWSLGPLEGRVHATRAGQEDAIEFDLEAPAIRPEGEGLVCSAALQGALEGGRLRVARLEVASDRFGSLSARVDVPLAPAQPIVFPVGEIAISLEGAGLELDTWSELVPARYRATGGVELACKLEGTWEHPRGTVRLEVVDLRPRSAEVPTELFPVRSTIALTLGENLRAAGSLSGGLGASTEWSGTLGAELDVPGLIADPGAFLSAPLDVKGELVLPQIAWVSKRVAALRRLTGRVRAHGTLAGTLAEPRLHADISLSEGELRAASDLPPLRELVLELGVDGDLWQVKELAGEVGGAPIRAAGTVDLASGAPVLDLTVSGENILLFRSPTTKVRASADLRLEGALDDLLASGELVLDEARHVQSIDLFRGLMNSDDEAPARGLVFSLGSGAPMSGIRLDVKVTSSAPFVVDNNITRAEFRPDLRIGGTGEVLLPRGTVYIDPSIVRLPSGKLRVDSGLLVFRRESPFLPDLSLKAHVRVRGFDIEAQITGPYDRPEILLTSTPPLPSDELLVLFLTGQLASGTAADTLGAAESVAVYVAQDVLSRWLFGADVDSEDDVVDRIDLSFGADVSQSGSPTVRAVYYLKERPRGTGRTSYLTAERDAWDRINYGVGLLFRFR